MRVSKKGRIQRTRSAVVNLEQIYCIAFNDFVRVQFPNSRPICKANRRLRTPSNWLGTRRKLVQMTSSRAMSCITTIRISDRTFAWRYRRLETRICSKTWRRILFTTSGSRPGQRAEKAPAHLRYKSEHWSSVRTNHIYLFNDGNFQMS